MAIFYAAFVFKESLQLGKIFFLFKSSNSLDKLVIVLGQKMTATPSRRRPLFEHRLAGLLQAGQQAFAVCKAGIAPHGLVGRDADRQRLVQGGQSNQ